MRLPGGPKLRVALKVAVSLSLVAVLVWKTDRMRQDSHSYVTAQHNVHDRVRAACAFGGVDRGD